MIAAAPRSATLPLPSSALQRLYGEAGFELPEDFHELPDHVAVELEFLYVVLFREASPGLDNDPARILELKTHFLEARLAAWIDPFTQVMKETAETRFFRELALATQRFVKLEANRRRAPRTG